MSTANVPPAAAGLRGQTVGSTEIATVGKEGVGLTYRGYAIEELADHASFEGVACPRAEPVPFAERGKRRRHLREPLKNVEKYIPAVPHPMDVLRTACSF